MTDKGFINLFKEEEPRTKLQNASMHLWHKMVSDALNNAGLDIVTVLNKGIPIPWTETMVKEILWRQTQMIMFNIQSTADLTSRQLVQVGDVVDRALSQNHGVHVPWPSQEQTEAYIKSLQATKPKKR